jgi:hypothetical protein
MSNHQNQSGQRRSLKAARRKRTSRGPWPVLIGSSCLCAAILLLALTANITLPWISQAISNNQMQPADSQEARMGTIELQTDQEQCDVMKFDNDTGRTIADSKRCHSNVTLDAHGVPIPMGTVHRLDSISKSFLGDGH